MQNGEFLVKADLTELSLEELWTLFPIILKKHNPNYKDWYEEEKQRIIRHVKPENIVPVSYTQLDVYKRQSFGSDVFYGVWPHG